MATLVPPQFGAVTTDTTAQTLASLNPVVNPPAPVAPPALTGPYPRVELRKQRLRRSTL